ncbi:lysozyme inhibitor LprI family protein [Pseudomonas monsensis]
MFALKLRHLLMLSAFAVAPGVHASSFDCASAGTPTEKTICADPDLSNLDQRLGSAWQSAVAKVADPKALKADQRGWLKQRNQCNEQVPCLRRQYLMRLTALEYMVKPFSWNSTWQLIPWGVSEGAELKTQRKGDSQITFDISAANGSHSGELEGVATVEGTQARYAEGDCVLTFTALNGLMDVTQTGDASDCGAGMGVYYGGRYVASKQTVAVGYDLLTLGVVQTRRENEIVHTLLGGDYQVLLQNCGITQTGDASVDVPNGEVSKYWVRGLPSSNAAIVMRAPDERIWLVVLVFDQQGKSRARYYTNVAEWKGRLPDALRAWHRDLGGELVLPLDFMP